MKSSDLDRLAEEVRAGQRASLARAITLVESTQADDAEDALALLERLLDHTGKSIRVGISGVPGVGKSTFIEALGMKLVERGHSVSVLAVDPSSAVSGGSLLGDKTRMADLSRADTAYVRPSPGGRTLGGVARRTREAMLVCEAAGHDVILVETIGVGQSEIAVAGMVDVFLLLSLAGAGDELQGIKRGITEMADVVVVNKADGDNEERAKQAAAELNAAVAMLRPSPLAEGETHRPVLTCSSRSGDGIDAVWDAVAALHAGAKSDGRLDERRRRQRVHWLDDAVDDLLRTRLDSDPDTRGARESLARAVREGALSPLAAAHQIVDVFQGEDAVDTTSLGETFPFHDTDAAREWLTRAVATGAGNVLATARAIATGPGDPAPTNEQRLTHLAELSEMSPHDALAGAVGVHRQFVTGDVPPDDVRSALDRLSDAAPELAKRDRAAPDSLDVLESLMQLEEDLLDR